MTYTEIIKSFGKDIDLIDLIDRQQAEIEKLKQENKMLNTTVINQCAFNKQDIYFARAEAIKEFAERLKEKSYTYSSITGYKSTVVDVCEIDGVMEEMVGED